MIVDAISFRLLLLHKVKLAVTRRSDNDNHRARDVIILQTVDIIRK